MSDYGTPDRPWLDEFVASLVAHALVWLGRRAAKRGDQHDLDHCLSALRAGGCDETCEPRLYVQKVKETSNA